MTNRVLFSAFSCLPYVGSEPGVGWNWAVQAARNPDLDVYVLTREKCRRKIEPAREALGLPNLHFIYVPSSARLRRASIYLEYVSWERRAYKYIRDNYGPDDFDVLWHTTFGNVFLPIWTHRLPYRFVWGPMGGGEHVPPRFYRDFPLKSSIPHRLKNVLIRTARHNPVVQGPARAASLVLARTEETRALLREEYRGKVDLTLETRMDVSSLPREVIELSMREGGHADGCVHVCYTGRLIALKNVDKLVRAVVTLLGEGLPLVLHLVGEGPLEGELKSIAAGHVGAGVIFHGRIPREDALRVVAASEVFAFPSLREGGSWSLMEAMALGRAIVCFDGSGMHEMTTDECAVRLPMEGPEQMEGQFGEAIRRLVRDSGLRRRLGEAARERVIEEYGWDEVRVRTRDVVMRVCDGE